MIRDKCNFLIGLTGTFIAQYSPHEIAAAFAGFATAIWMLTQSTILVLKHRQKPTERKNENETQ